MIKKYVECRLNIYSHYKDDVFVLLSVLNLLNATKNMLVALRSIIKRISMLVV